MAQQRTLKPIKAKLPAAKGKAPSSLPLIQYAEASGGAQQTKIAAQTAAIQDRFGKQFQQFADTLAKGGLDQPSQQKLIQNLRALGTVEGAPQAEYLKQIYEPAITKALAVAGLRPEDIAKELLPLLEIPATAWQPGSFLAGSVGLRDISQEKK